MYESKENLPIVMDIPGVKSQLSKWGKMNVSRMQLSKGVDFTPMLKGLPNDLCQCPHWGVAIGANRTKDVFVGEVCIFQSW